jgi:competence protein ComEC
MQGKVKVFEEVIAAQRGRLILWLPVAAGAGSALYFALKFEPPGILAGGALALLVLLAGLMWPWRAGAGAARAAWVTLVLLLWAAVGFALAQVRTGQVAAPMVVKEIRVTGIEGTVAEVEILEEGGGQRIILTDLVIEKLAPENTPHRVRLKIRDGENVPVGARVRTLGSLNPPSPPVLPGAFDFQRFAYFKQIGAFGFTFKPLEIIAPPAPAGIAARAEILRQTIVARIDAEMPRREASIATALMIGERAAISEEDWEAMRISGLAHMISISGMHVGLVAGLVFFAVRFGMAAVPPIALRWPIKKIAAVAALCAAAFYTGLAVPSVPSYRALLMTGLILLAVMLDRKAFSMRTIAVAALIVLVVVPESVWSASFQMSFAATAALIFVFEETAPLWAKWRADAGPVRRGFLYVAGVCMTTIVAGSATAPFGIFHFQQYAAYSVLANLLAVPVLSFVVMPMIIVSFLLLPLGWEKPVLVVMEEGISLINRISHQVADLPGAQVVVPGLPLAALVLFSAGIIIFMLWAGRSRYVLAAIPVIAAVGLIAMHRMPDIVVAADAELAAVRMTDGRISLSTARKDKFTAEIWTRHFGNEEGSALYWPREGEGAGGMMCDPAGCHVIVKDEKIAFSFTEEGQAEDCAWADIVIARDPVRRECAAATVVDFFDLRRGGAHAFYVGADGRVSVESVAQDRGVRPWAVSAAR